MKIMTTKNNLMTATATAALLASAGANAALPQGVQDAINSGFTDANSAMGLMIVGFAGLFAIGLVMKLLRR